MSSSSVDIDTCGICKKRFNKDDRKPKFLTCYHTYCYTCLTSIKEERKKTDGGGVEFTCPSCHKVTRVGKKGVRLLHDNNYIRVQSANSKAQQDEVYLSDDDHDDGGGCGGDDDDTSTPKSFDAANNRAMKVWCNTCLKVADTECAEHDICNLELGKKCLNERLHRLLEQADMELHQEIGHREPLFGHLQTLHQAWTSSLSENLKDETNKQSMALSVAQSELEMLDNFKRLTSEDDPTHIVSAISSIEGILRRSRSCVKTTVKQMTLMSTFQTSRITIQPVLDIHNKNDEKLQNLVIDVVGSNSDEEKALVYLMYHILEEKGGKTGAECETWHVVDRAGKVKYDGRHDESQHPNATVVI